MLQCLVTAALLLQSNPGPAWEVPLGGPPRSGPLLVDTGDGMDIFIPLGNRGLAGYSGAGAALPGFPMCAASGVNFKPAGLPAESGAGALLCFVDNDGLMHLADTRGQEEPGWPVDLGAGPVTGVSALDLDMDGGSELAVGTADGMLHLLRQDGIEVSGWPVQAGARLQWAPSQLPLGGGQGYALVAALSSAKVSLYSSSGQIMTGWPVNLGFAIDTSPVCADISGDGIADAIFATGDRRVNVLGLRGFQESGWPYFLDKRALQGTAALGSVDPSAGGLQIALSTSDSLVYLLDPDGSLAGTWRWPVRADGLPTSPVITTGPDGETIVVVATSSGSIQAWDGEGARVEDATFDLGEGILHAPAAGDVDGDGRIEVVAVGMAGRLAAFDLGSSDPGPWPQSSADSRNSGSYGLAFLPIVETGEVEGEFTTQVPVPFEVSGPPATAISVAFSADAGYSWHETTSYTVSGSILTWFAALDLGRLDSRDCLIRITPLGASGPGIADVTNIFHVDNNAPPTLYLGNPIPLPGGQYRMPYAVEDPEGDLVQIQAQYSVDAGASWLTARLSGTTLEIDPWLYGDPFVWNPAGALEGVDSSLVRFRARAADDDTGPWSSLNGMRVDSTLAPIAQIVTPSSETGGDVRLGVRLVSGSGRESLVRYEFSVDGGMTWRPATVIPKTEGLTGAYDVELVWQSRADAPGVDCDSALVRASGTDSLPGVAVPSAPFHLDNDYPPSVVITSPTGHGVFDGLVPVSFSIADPEGDDISIRLEYRLDRGSSWRRARGILGRSVFGTAEYRSVLRWNTSEDLIGIDQTEVEFRLVAMDRDSSVSETEGPIALRNGSLPSVVQALVYSIDASSRQLSVRFELSDPRNRTLDLSVSWSSDGGATWADASVTGSATGLRSPGYAGEVVWRYGSDLSGTGGRVLLRLTPISSDVAGPPRILESVVTL